MAPSSNSSWPTKVRHQRFYKGFVVLMVNGDRGAMARPWAGSATNVGICVAERDGGLPASRAPADFAPPLDKSTAGCPE